jgi:CRP-like cAMP-binding protein
MDIEDASPPPIIPWMEFKDQERWDKALHLGRRIVWKAKATIQNPDDEVSSIFLIRQGVIKLSASSSEGVQRTLWFMGPGSILGEAALFAGQRNAHYVAAVEDCVAYEFSRRTVVEEILVRFPDLGEALLTNLATKAYIMSTQVEESTFLSAYRRICRFFYGICLQRGSRQVSLSHTVISELLGLHRVTVSNAIRDLKRRGLLEEHGHDIMVSDLDALAEFMTSDI